MMTQSRVEPALFRENRLIPQANSSLTGDWSNPGAAEARFEFGRFHVLLRQRQLLADGAPIELGTGGKARSKVAFPADLSATAARSAVLEVTWADLLMELALRPPRLAGTGLAQSF